MEFKQEMEEISTKNSAAEKGVVEALQI